MTLAARRGGAQSRLFGLQHPSPKRQPQRAMLSFEPCGVASWEKQPEKTGLRSPPPLLAARVTTPPVTSQPGLEGQRDRGVDVY